MGSATVAAAPPANGRQRLRATRSQGGSRSVHLDLAQATAIYEAATFVLQAYWRPFNARVRLGWRAEPERDDRWLARSASEFLHNLQLRMKAWGDEDARGFHRIVLNERSRAGNPFTTLVGHVPDRHVERAKTWLAEPGRRNAFGVDITLDIEPLPTSWPRAAERHWTLVRELWRGVDPSLCVDAARSLLDVLDVAPNRRRPSGMVACRRFALSDGLGPAARRKAASEFLPHLSAFGERQWDWVSRGWERGEFESRQAESEKHRAKRMSLQRQFGEGGQLAAAGLWLAINKDKQKQTDKMKFRPTPWNTPI